ncbi:hypothetical protein GALMADRAFT_136933 [Galerina marginata CBS 339.88]|uniref:Retrovirus-related Pol polyprotein from transposon TNT 1-94-like beta-barrel domain-containing protein n=1 Tax=Galerina marginata (strain CBS 339.88) TaxID=685588 RepID=A0A067TKP0_GALM3|nr:hypothetical protein GALMADRAFT_136933 [Galerina marginata CBS 339.88]
MPSKRSSTKSSTTKPEPSSRRKPKTTSPLTGTARTSPCHLVVDLSLPSHIINDRSLFTTYTPSRQVHRTVFGNKITIEGVGDAHIRVFAAGKFILLRMRNCWHVPSSPHHFLSCPTITSTGCQVVIASRTPRVLFSHKRCLAEPNLPKYLPLTKIDGYFILKYEVPVPGSVFPQPPSTTNQTPAISLHAPAYQPFSALSVPLQSHAFNSSSPLAHFAPLDDSYSQPFHFSGFSFLHKDPSAFQAPQTIPISDTSSSLDYSLFNSQPSLSSPSFNNSPLNPFSEAPISIIPSPIPTFNPQSIHQPQHPSLFNPLPDHLNFIIPPINPPSKTLLPIISYPVPSFNPQSIQQLYTSSVQFCPQLFLPNSSSTLISPKLSLDHPP